MTAINATLQVKYKPADISFNSLLDNGSIDASGLFMPLKWTNNGHLILFPYYHDEFISIKQAAGLMSTLYKIIHLWSYEVLIISLIAIVILIMVFFMQNNNDFSTATLETIRLLTYVSILTPFNRQSTRIYLSTMLLFAVINNGVFQGSIFKFLTTQQKLRRNESIYNYIRKNYTVFVPPGTFNFFKEVLGPYSNIVEEDLLTCLDSLKHYQHNICIHIKDYFYGFYTGQDIDIIREKNWAEYFVITFRKNSPLYHRFNEMAMRITESGLFGYWRRQQIQGPVGKYHAKEIALSLPRYQPVALTELDFVFLLLAIGLIVSTIVFIFEFIFKYE